MSEHPGLAFHVVAPGEAADADGPWAGRVRGFAEAVSRAFLQPRGGDERHRRWLAHLGADGVTLRGAWAEDAVLGDADLPVATVASWTGDLNVGDGRRVDLHQVTDVTVAPTHRRRGLVRRLLTEDLADATARGLPVAALTVSEGSIYGRFGFGPATTMRALEVDTTSRFALRADVAAALGRDAGRTVVVEPATAWPAVREVSAAAQRSTRGQVARSHFHEGILTGAFRLSTNAPDADLRALVHLGADDRPDGYALYRPVDEDDGARLDVEDLTATSEATTLRLWSALASVDLVRRVRWRRARVTEPLEHALVEPRVVTTTALDDLLWVRVLDVVAALEARPWYDDASVVLAVDDPLGLAGGTWRLEARDGTARVRPSDEEAQVRVGADTLGSLYLGGHRVATLAAAGRVAGDPAAVARFAALADGGPEPSCTTPF